MRKVLVSIHIPKVAGTHFRRMISVLPVDAFYYSYGKHPEAGLHLRNKGDVRQTDQVWSERVGRFVRDGAPLIETLLIHGHVLASDYLPWVPEANFITWLRDPVQRVASHYYFWKRMNYSFDKDWVEFHEASWSLLEFAEQPKYRNMQAMYLRGLRVPNMRFVGVVEKFEASLRRFEAIFDVKLPRPKAQVNENPDKEGEVWHMDDETRNALAALNEADCELYSEALAILG